MSNPPTDTISELHFHPQGDFLAAASWDNAIRIYEFGFTSSTTVASQAKTEFKHEAPVMSCRWSNDGQWLATAGGGDYAIRLWDVNTMSQLGSLPGHELSVRSVRWADEPGIGSAILASASWDRSLKYWDLRQNPNAPIATVQLLERAYAMDCRFPWIIVGTAERHIQWMDLRNPATCVKSIESPLKWQTRVISCFSQGPPGYAVGSIEGRCGITYINDKDAAANFSFKAHRKEETNKIGTNSEVYPVHSIAFHPVYGTFSTAGGDGAIIFWDKDAKQRLKQVVATDRPITASAFNRDGRIFAYATGYDWARGSSGMPNLSSNTRLVAFSPLDEDIKSKPKKR